jgi:hypothetical protein
VPPAWEYVRVVRANVKTRWWREITFMNTGVCKGLDAQSWKDLTEESFGNMPIVTVLDSPFPLATTAIPVLHRRMHCRA